MSDLQKKQIIDVINEQLNNMYDDLHVLQEYGVRECGVLGKAILRLEAVQREIVEIFDDEDMAQGRNLELVCQDLGEN